MQLSDITTQIGYRIRTASRTFITDAEILAELNRSLDRLTSKVDLQPSIRETSITFTGDGAYALPSDFKKPVEIYDRNNLQKYKRVSLAELRESEQTGFNLYAIDGSNVRIESSASSATLNFVYYSTYDAASSTGTLQKGLSASTDVPLLQARHHDYFVEDVASILLRKEGKMDDYTISKREATTILQDIYADNETQEEVVNYTIGSYPEEYE